MSEPRRYRHQPKLSTTLFAIAFFGACAAFAFWTSARNDRGLIINGIITLETRGADVFWAVIGVLSCGFVAMGLYGVVRALGPPQYVVLHDDVIELPASLFRRARRVPYRDVRKIELWETQGQK